MQELIDIYFHFYGVTTPELNIMPESQLARSDNIKLYSELYDKGQVTAKSLAEKILGTCSAKEVNELAQYIEGKQREAQAQQQLQIQTQPINQSQGPLGSGSFDVDVSEAGSNK